MGGRHSRRHPYSGYPGSLPIPPEDVFSGHYMASTYPITPTMPVSPMDQQMDLDPYYGGYAGFPGAMRRVSSDPNLVAYDPYMQYGMFPGYDPYGGYDQNPYGAYGYPPPPAERGMGPRWGSLPNLYDMPPPPGGFVHLSRNPRQRPLLQKLFGPSSVAQRRNILKRLDHQQMDPFEKTAQWLMQSDQRRMR